MNKVITLLFAFALTIGNVTANDSCRILLNKMVIFKGTVDSDEPVGLLKAKQFKKTDRLTIEYYTENPGKGWYRTYDISNGNGNNIKTIESNKQSGSVSVNASLFNKAEVKKEPLFIYTTSLPVDKAMAARVRVRRVLVCKIEWN